MYDSERRVITPDMLADDPFHPSIVDFEARMNPAPFFAIALIAVNLLIFLWELKTGALKNKEAIIAAGAIYAEKVFSGEMWRIATGMFLHASWGHLIGNSVSLYLLALGAERAWGGWRAFMIYACSGLAASLVSASMQSRPAVGASGAIFGLMGAVVVFFYRYREAFRPRDRRIGKILLLWGIYQVAMGALSTYVDNCAHLGGAAAGALFGALLTPTLFWSKKD